MGQRLVKPGGAEESPPPAERSGAAEGVGRQAFAHREKAPNEALRRSST
jgi:hypothetical protein